MNPIHQTFNTFLTTALNEQQRAAVLQANNALLVIAGAGSGKTRVITSRIANLVLNEQVAPHTIVALTFTNKAAGEMRDRLVATFQGQYRLPFIGTFHSYCLTLLRTMPTQFGLPHFTIMDADDQLDLIKKIMKRFAVAKHVTANQVCHQISQYKNRMFDPIARNEQWLTPMLQEIYLTYETEKTNAHCLDFDDLIVRVLQGLKSNPTLRTQLQNNIRHLLVDEYQDTNSAQHQLLVHLATANNKFCLDSLCAVGDEDQSIYSWRGATVANMLTFQNDFAPVTIIKIEQNYRSAQPILEAANAVIANNQLRNPKNLWSTKKASNRIVRFICETGDQEARMVAGAIKTLSATTPLSQIAVLYRTHYQSRPLEEALIHQATPYRIIGGIRFYERKEIKDLLAYLRLIVNPYDKVSLMRIINTPARGLGQKFEEQLLTAWMQNPFYDFVQLLTWMLTDPSFGLTDHKSITLKQFLALFAELNKTQPPSVLLERILNTTQYLSYLTSSYDTQEAQTKIENVQEFEQALFMFENKFRVMQQTEPSAPSANTAADPKAVAATALDALLVEVALLQDTDNSNDGQAETIQLMTLHAAKGLEFGTVIITGLEEGLLPSSRSLNAHEALEEERRLMYVGITRAEERLILCNAHSRLTFGQITDQAPSRFLTELPRALIKSIDLEETSFSAAMTTFDRWISGKPEQTTYDFSGTVTMPTGNPFQSHTPKPKPGPSSWAQAATKTGNYHATGFNRSGLTGGAPRCVTSIPKAREAEPATAPVKQAPVSPWAKHQVVQHQKFGVGIVELVERGSEDFMVTVAFKGGKKKILARFLAKI
jgi:DNA helicase-2/ATP-dependent DNA helicase PcrA